MARTTIDELKRNRLAAMSAQERAIFDETYEATRLALDVGEKVRDAREAAGLSQRELAARMGTSQAAVARLEAGGVGATLTTLQKVAARSISRSPSNCPPRAEVREWMIIRTQASFPSRRGAPTGTRSGVTRSPGRSRATSEPRVGNRASRSGRRSGVWISRGSTSTD